MDNTKNVHCRLCAELKPLDELTNLQTDTEMCQKVVNKLSRFNIIMDFKQNVLPKTVCLLCVTSLESAFTFVTAVEQAQALLSDIYLLQINNEKGDPQMEDTFFLPSVIVDEEIDVKIENLRDPMDLNDDDLDEKEFDDDNMYIEELSVVVEKVDIKNENDDFDDNNINNNDCRENQELNVSENDYENKDTVYPEFKKVLTENELEKELNSETMKNIVYSTDDVNKLSHSTADTNSLGEVVHHIECTTPSSQQLETTMYSEEYINKQINRLAAIPEIECLKMTWIDYEWKCSCCGTVFSNIEELQTHSMRYHNFCNSYQCTDCNIRKERLNAFIKHVRSHRKYLHYSCYKCFKKFPRTMDTSQHKAKVHENSKYVCVGCNSPFTSKAELDEHVKKHYKILWKNKPIIPNENLTCSTCNKVCATFTALRNHLNKHKEKNKVHLCDRCGKCFESDPILRSHMETHTERAFICEICKSTFKSVYTLRYHSSIHSGIKPFACDFCSKLFRTKHNLRNHIKCHMDYSPINCTVCSKKFRTVVNLQHHMLQHTGEKPFSCNICPRDFTNLSNRNKHMRHKHGIEMARKKQLIIKQQTDDMASSGLGHEEAIFADLDKINERKNLNGKKTITRTKKLK